MLRHRLHGTGDAMTEPVDAVTLGIGTPSPPPKREWVGLTDEEIKKMRHLIDWTAGWSYNTFARAIKAKLKEKNT